MVTTALALRKIHCNILIRQKILWQHLVPQYIGISDVLKMDGWLKSKQIVEQTNILSCKTVTVCRNWIASSTLKLPSLHRQIYTKTDTRATCATCPQEVLSRCPLMPRHSKLRTCTTFLRMLTFNFRHMYFDFLSSHQFIIGTSIYNY